MSDKYTKPADLVERHKEYCFGMFDAQGQQIEEGDVRALCNAAGIAATFEDERHVAFAEYLGYARQFNLAGLPAEPLNINRLSILLGAGENMMHKFFKQDIEKAEDAVKAGDRLDPAAQDTRGEIIERVLADTSALIQPIAAWLAADNNKSMGHPFATDDLIGNFFMRESKYFIVDFPDATTLFDRVNAALEGHGLALLPDSMAGPRHNVSGAAHLRLLPGGKTAPKPS